MNFKKLLQIGLLIVCLMAVAWRGWGQTGCNCPDELLALDMTRFPADSFEIHGNTIVFIGECNVSAALFEPQDVLITNNCINNPNISVEYPDTFGDILITSAFCSPLPRVRWIVTGTCTSGAVSDTLEYQITLKIKFSHFTNEFASLLGVDTVIRNNIYQVCDIKSVFQAIDENDTNNCSNIQNLSCYANFQPCNAGVTVSTGRKKQQFTNNPAEAKSSSAEDCVTYQLFWTYENDCLFFDTAFVYIKYCAALQIIPDSFPPNLVSIRNDSIIAPGCYPSGKLKFDPEDVEVIGSCNTDIQIQIGTLPQRGTPSLNEDISASFGQLSCEGSFPIVTWYGVVNIGAVLDTITSLTYTVAITHFSGFSKSFANLLGVDTVLINGIYSKCDESGLDSASLVNYAKYPDCNTSASVSTGRKKTNFTGSNAVEKIVSSPCDTFQLTWTPVKKNTNTPCDIFPPFSVFVTIDETPPVFNLFPADVSIPPGTTPIFGTPIAEDNCTQPTLSFIDDVQVMGSDTLYTRTWIADDGCNSNYATQTITVKALRLDCPGDILVTTPSGAAGAVVSWQAPHATTPCDQGSGNCQPESIPGFNLIGELSGRLYYISTTEKNWTDAKADCEANGGRLAIADTQEKNNFLAGGIGYFSAAFIGLSDKDSEGNFTWLDGTPVSFQFWEPGQPDGIDAQDDYVAMHGWSNGRWADYNFWTAKKYILEKPCGTGGSGLNIVQTAGLPSGSFFPVGSTSIRFMATDACGNTANCSFTVTVEEDQVPTGCLNYALNRPTAQSSTRFNAPASRAVDGNTSGNFWLDFSISHTEWEDYPWWEVTLDKVFQIDQINVWNRTDCCVEHLSGFYVLVSDVPFASYNLTQTLAQPGVSAYYFPGQAGTPSTFTINRTGKYVRVHSNKQTFLALSEVEVLGCGINLTAPPSGSLLFEARLRDGKEVALRWAESFRPDLAYFIIEKSTDGLHFAPLSAKTTPKEAGSRALYLDYDRHPVDGANFYRLKSVLTDGVIEYSPVRRIEFNIDEDFTIFPNPANNEVYVYLERFAGRDVTIWITNPFGQLFYQQSFTDLQQDVLKLDLQQRGIRSGVYFVSILHKGRAVTKRLVVAE